MRAYVCDWCGRAKKSGERWILGFAMERTGSTGTEREISITSAWSDRAAEHPFAVHFCSPAHKSSYIAALFEDNSSSSARKSRSKRLHAASKTEAARSACIAAAPVQSEATAKRVSSPAAKRTRRHSKGVFTEADHIHSRGMSIRLHPTPPVGEEAAARDEGWGGS